MSADTFFLTDFIDEILRTDGAALAGYMPKPTRDSVEEEFRAAARTVAADLFGEQVPIEVEIAKPLGDVRLYQRLVAVSAPAERRLEVSLGSLREAGPDFAAATEGQELRIPILYHPAREERAWLDAHAALAQGVPLPLASSDLYERFTEHINGILLRYFPAPPVTAGTLGALLQEGGLWTAGLTARSGELEITLERGYWDFYRTRQSSGWVDYGFVTVFRQNGKEVFRGNPGTAVRPGCLEKGEKTLVLTPFQSADNDQNVHCWASLPTSEAARPAVLAALQAIVDELAAGRSPHESPLQALLTATIAPPVPGGLWHWMEQELPRLLVGHRHEIARDGVTFTFEVTGVATPCASLSGFGHVSVTVLSSAGDSDLPADDEGVSIAAGRATPAALSIGPESLGERERSDLQRLAVSFRDWLDDRCEHYLAHRAPESPFLDGYMDSSGGYFPLADLLEQRVRLGPPGPAPVPALDAAAIERATRLVRPLDSAAYHERVPEESVEHMIAAFDIAGWTLALFDDVSKPPFGSQCGINLAGTDGQSFSVMMVDAWNPSTRTVVDGDAFAFRRFVTWLRGAVLAGGYDRELCFRREQYEWDADEEDDGETEDQRILLSDWLFFGLPDDGDRFLLDWRAQWDIVNAANGIETFAGIYGFSGERLESILRHDVPAWRRFLCEVIDSRFEGSSGHTLLRRRREVPQSEAKLLGALEDRLLAVGEAQPVESVQESKASLELTEALADERNKRLRVGLVLGMEDIDAKPVGSEPQPEAFANGAAYREAFRAWGATRFAVATCETREAFQRLGLELHERNHGDSTVEIVGTPAQLKTALGLEMVASAWLIEVCAD